MLTQKEPLKQRDSNGRFLPGNSLGWLPGESGNAKGTPPHSVTTLLKNMPDEDKKVIATQLTTQAKEGDLKAIDMFIDRTDGKVQGDAPIQDNRVFNLYISEKGAKARALIAEVTKDATE